MTLNIKWCQNVRPRHTNPIKFFCVLKSNGTKKWYIVMFRTRHKLRMQVRVYTLLMSELLGIPVCHKVAEIFQSHADNEYLLDCIETLYKNASVMIKSLVLYQNFLFIKMVGYTRAMWISTWRLWHSISQKS